MSEMTPERESALDHLLDPDLWLNAGFRGENVDYAECPPRERVDRARAELAALRQRCDYYMALHQHDVFERERRTRYATEAAEFYAGGRRRTYLRMRKAQIERDRALRLLTPAAREALRKP